MSQQQPTQRVLSIDWLKGLIVPVMIYCHVLQFFGNIEAHAAIDPIIMVINVLIFPTFLFLYGRTTQLAYLQKPFRAAWPRMLHQAWVLYAAFAISGIGYRLLAEKRPMRHTAISDVLMLQDIPGWSEFLISFALFALLMLVGFGLWRAVSGKLWAALGLSAASLAFAALMPYDKVSSVPLALVTGGTQFAYFPVLPYLMYPLMGLYIQRNGMQKKWIWLGTSALMTLTSAGHALTQGGWPSRFPPSPMWVMLTALPLCLLHLLSEWWSAFREQKLADIHSAPLRRILSFPRDIIQFMGRHSLFFLVSSNLVLFTMRGMGLSPQFMNKLAFPWNQQIRSPLGALSWTAVLLAALTLLLLITGLPIAPKERRTPKMDAH